MNGNLSAGLSSGQVVCFDTAPLIYFIEEHSVYLPILKNIFGEVSKNEIHGIASHLALIEVLVKPLQAGAYDIAARYRDILLCGALKMCPLEEKIAEKAARIKAVYGIKTPDAIHVATAICGNADIFITNDKRLRAVKEIKVLMLDDFVPSTKPKRGAIASFLHRLFG